MPFFKSVAVFFVLYPMNAFPSVTFLLVKCFPIASLCLFVIMHGMNFKFEYSYSRRIFTGLLFSMLGDACLVYKEEWVFVFGFFFFRGIGLTLVLIVQYLFYRGRCRFFFTFVKLGSTKQLKRRIFSSFLIFNLHLDYIMKGDINL